MQPAREVVLGNTGGKKVCSLKQLFSNNIRETNVKKDRYDRTDPPDRKLAPVLPCLGVEDVAAQIERV